MRTDNVPDSNTRIMEFLNYTSLYANHSEMYKFSNADDEGYIVRV